VLGLLHAETLLGDNRPANHLKLTDDHSLVLRRVLRFVVASFFASFRR
jgi:hypothetical protein